uniref:Uncharacterized protein n=1 Tax=Arundo donax TaxID=35708 RepID=A0A0A9F2L8_ARUDO
MVLSAPLHPLPSVARCRSKKMIMTVAHLCCTTCSALFRRHLKGFTRKTFLCLAKRGSGLKSHLILDWKFAIYSGHVGKLNIRMMQLDRHVRKLNQRMMQPCRHVGKLNLRMMQRNRGVWKLNLGLMLQLQKCLLLLKKTVEAIDAAATCLQLTLDFANIVVARWLAYAT